MSAYCPHRGDIVWLTFSPQSGHEQAGHRPALVLSPESYNRKTGLAVLCPITSHEKGYPFEVKIPVGFPISGVVIADQIKNLDWKARQTKFGCRISSSILFEVLRKLDTFLAISKLT